MRLTVFSFLLLVACGVPRPDSDLCINNVPAKHKKCYNMLRDYDDNGNLLPNAKATFKPLNSLADVNKDLDVDPVSLGRLKAYLRTLREERANCQ